MSIQVLEEPTLLSKIGDIKEAQETVDKMLSVGFLALKWPENKTEIVPSHNEWVLDPLYESHDVSVGVASVDEILPGPYLSHTHINAKEYLIVIKGSIMFCMDGREIRLVKEGECCSVEPGISHHSKPLTEDTKVVYVCVPNENMEN